MAKGRLRESTQLRDKQSISFCAPSQPAETNVATFRQPPMCFNQIQSPSTPFAFQQSPSLAMLWQFTFRGRDRDGDSQRSVHRHFTSTHKSFSSSQYASKLTSVHYTTFVFKIFDKNKKKTKTNQPSLFNGSTNVCITLCYIIISTLRRTNTAIVMKSARASRLCAMTTNAIPWSAQ